MSQEEHVLEGRVIKWLCSE